MKVLLFYWNLSLSVISSPILSFVPDYVMGRGESKILPDARGSSVPDCRGAFPFFCSPFCSLILKGGILLWNRMRHPNTAMEKVTPKSRVKGKVFHFLLLSDFLSQRFS